MKKILIICALFISTGSVYGQAGNWKENNANGEIRHDNEFANTEMSTSGREITFSDLPELKKTVWAIITDPDGNRVTQKRIDPTNNVMDVHKLPKGAMYFVTLMYKNKSQKAFVLHL